MAELMSSGKTNYLHRYARRFAPTPDRKQIEHIGAPISAFGVYGQHLSGGCAGVLAVLTVSRRTLLTTMLQTHVIVILVVVLVGLSMLAVWVAYRLSRVLSARGSEQQGQYADDGVL